MTKLNTLYLLCSYLLIILYYSSTLSFLLEQASCSTPQRSFEQRSPEPSSPMPGTIIASHSSQSPPPASSTASYGWAETFKVPWEVMPSGIKLAIANNKRPSPADRRQLVRMVVDAIRRHEVNPSRAQCQIIAQSIVKKYPDSFADVLSDGMTIGSGYGSLLVQLKTRVEHVNRNNTLARRRKERVRSAVGSMTSNSRRPVDQYGCVRWQPEELPVGENENTLEEKRKELVQLYSTQGVSGADRGEVHQLMEVTYYRQRCDINAIPPPSLSVLKNSWPYLFCLKGISIHFQLLTDIPLVHRVMEGFEVKGRRILRFFQEKPSNDQVRGVLAKYEEGNCLVLAILQLVMAHFKEERASLLIEVDVSNLIYM